MTTRLLILLAAALLCWVAPVQGQTIKSLGYNSTNGHIVAATNVTFTNSVGFATNARAATRTNLGLGATWLTNTNVTNFRTAIGLGTSNNASFESLTIGALSGDPLTVESYQIESPTFGFLFNLEESRLAQGGNNIFTWSSTNASFDVPVRFATNVTVGGTLTVYNAAATMRALAGSTNTNEPYSGTVALTNTNVLTFSNGVLLKIQ